MSPKSFTLAAPSRQSLLVGPQPSPRSLRSQQAQQAKRPSARLATGRAWRPPPCRPGRGRRRAMCDASCARQ
eukprot:7262250-Alexandrium_andersonii.AAC.1